MTQPYIDAGDLIVIGLVQEQHPERAQLYAQWREMDWPIMWDPFNTTGALAVPYAYMIDECGVLQGKRLNEDSLAAFMEAEFDAPEDSASTSHYEHKLVQTPASHSNEEESVVFARWLALSDATWRRDNERRTSSSLHVFRYMTSQEEAYEPTESDYFCLGVLYRMRYDSDDREEGDFQAAIDAWAKALEMDPNQYIWRRRIQQYGPMSDKPYPFYDWVETAQREIAERGETPVVIPQALTQAELGTEGSALVPEGDTANPDPDGRITADATGIITVTSATTPDTQRPGSRRVLIELATTEAGHWNNEAEPLMVWIDAEALPAGWSVESSLLVHQLSESSAASSDEQRVIDFGLTHPADATGTHTLTGYALYNVCEAGDLGRCLYRRQDFEVTVVLD